jgi:putative Mn2+ efflux pump MntP
VSALLSTFIIGISLSMDAFSLALAYGTVGLSKRQEIILSIIVGTFHFFMPLVGLFFGNIILSHFTVNVNLLVAVIFGIIGVEMVISSIKDEEVKVLVSFVGFFLFGLSVSIDSFTTGIGLSIINQNYLQVSFIFAIVSSVFTYLGLRLGVKLNESYGRYSTFIGGIILIMLGIYYLF